MVRLAIAAMLAYPGFGMADTQGADAKAPDTQSGVIFMESGARNCSAVAAPSGFWTARHCLGHSGLSINGQPIRHWSGDPVRDLAHIAGSGPGPGLRAAVAGDVLEVRTADRAPLRVRVARWTDVSYDAGTYTINPWRGGWLAIVACHLDGRAVALGDSGAGAWHGTGELAAIVVAAKGAADPGKPYVSDPDCGFSQSTVLVGLP